MGTNRAQDGTEVMNWSGKRKHIAASSSSYDDDDDDADDGANDQYLKPRPLARALQRVVEKGVPLASKPLKDDRWSTLQASLSTQKPGDSKAPAPGTWMFLSTTLDNTTAKAAVACFANEPGFGTEGVKDPTAAHIFHIRASTQYYLNTGVLQPLLPENWDYHDPTIGIKIKFIENDLTENELALKDTMPADSIDVPAEDFHYGYDQFSKLQHDPLNRGVNDQRGLDGEAKYATREINGQIVTLDRSVALVNKPHQKHKVWIFKGRWIQYPEALVLDWSDKEAISALNKWRNQSLERSGWPLLHKARKAYSAEERTWLFKQISLAGGKKPEEGYGLITKRFNEHFGLEGDKRRHRDGITTIYKRLIDEYNEYDGKQKPQKERRTAKKMKMDDGEGIAIGEEDEEEEHDDNSFKMDKFLGNFIEDDDNESEVYGRSQSGEEDQMERGGERKGGDGEENSGSEEEDGSGADQENYKEDD